MSFSDIMNKLHSYNRKAIQFYGSKFRTGNTVIDSNKEGVEKKKLEIKELSEEEKSMISLEIEKERKKRMTQLWYIIPLSLVVFTLIMLAFRWIWFIIF